MVTEDRSEFGDVFVLLLCVDMGEYRFDDEPDAPAAVENAVGEPFRDAYGWLVLLGDAAAMRYDRCWRYTSVGDSVPDELSGEPRDDKYG